MEIHSVDLGSRASLYVSVLDSWVTGTAEWEPYRHLCVQNTFLFRVLLGSRFPRKIEPGHGGLGCRESRARGVYADIVCRICTRRVRFNEKRGSSADLIELTRLSDSSTV